MEGKEFIKKLDFIEETDRLLPASPGEKPDWKAIEKSPLGSFFPEMESTPQNPLFHGEGDVGTHTRMVCEELTGGAEFWEMTKLQRVGLFTAALLHDAGKIRTTRQEDGCWISPNHSAAGSMLARKLLWQNCGLCGSAEKRQLRELICMLIRWHMQPLHLFGQEDAARRAAKIASAGELIPDFSWKMLCALAEADAKGRIAPDTDEELERIALCRMLAEEAGCLAGPYPFRNAYTKRAFLSGRNVLPGQSLYDDTWGEIVMMSGLPGTGKDTWIRGNLPELPMISLDEIRKEKGIRPADNQGPVIQEAQERAKELLRKRRAFVWNATGLTRDIRQKAVSLFERYGARVRIVYLETEWDTLVQRNRSREAQVPAGVIDRMLARAVPPMPEEAGTVEWLTV